MRLNVEQLARNSERGVRALKNLNSVKKMIVFCGAPISVIQREMNINLRVFQFQEGLSNFAKINNFLCPTVSGFQTERRHEHSTN